MNLSPVSKNLFIISFVSKYHLTEEFWLKNFNLKLLNDPLAF